MHLISLRDSKNNPQLFFVSQNDISTTLYISIALLAQRIKK